MLNTGSAIQGQGQNTLNAVQPQLAQGLPSNRLAALGQGLNMIPGSTMTQTQGQTPPQPGILANLVSGANLASGLGFGGGIGGLSGGAGANPGLQNYGINALSRLG